MPRIAPNGLEADSESILNPQSSPILTVRAAVCKWHACLTLRRHSLVISHTPRYVWPMPDSEAPHDSEADDWFVNLGDEPRVRGGGAPVVEPPGGESSATDDWFHGDRPSRKSEGPNEGLTVSLGTLLAGAAVLLVLILVVGLAIGGAFSGGKNKAATTAPTTTAQTPTTTSTTPATAAAVPAPATTLKPGDSGAQVKRLQRALKHLGYTVGKVDGDYGTSTQAAVQAFQKASKLAADGVLGPKTLLALKQALQTKR